MPPTIESGIYKITSAHQYLEILSLEKGFLKGNLIVEKQKPDPNQELAPYQQWAVVNQSEGIFTFKSLAGDAKGSKKPYAKSRGEEEERSDEDPYIRGGDLDIFCTYKIIPHLAKDKEPEFIIRLPGRPKSWTIIEGSKNIILEEYDVTTSPKENQLWKFQLIHNFQAE